MGDGRIELPTYPLSEGRSTTELVAHTEKCSKKREFAQLVIKTRRGKIPRRVFLYSFSCSDCPMLSGPQGLKLKLLTPLDISITRDEPHDISLYLTGRDQHSCPSEVPPKRNKGGFSSRPEVGTRPYRPEFPKR